MSLKRHMVRLSGNASLGLYEVIEETVHDNGSVVRGETLGHFRSLDEAIKFKDNLDEMSNHGCPE